MLPTPKLLGVPKPFDDECPIGYLMRVAQVNGVKGIYKLFRLAGFHWKNSRLPIKSILFGELDIYPILQALGCNHSIPTLALLKSQFATKYTSKSQIGPFSKYPKVCPTCLEQYKYAKVNWLLTSFLSCPEHNTLLVDTHPKANKRLSWYRDNLYSFDSDLGFITSKIEDESVLNQLSHVLTDKFINSNESKYCQNPLLEKTSIPDFTELLNFIAHFVSKQRYSHKFCPQTEPLNLQRRIMRETWGILYNWPDRFNELLGKWSDSGDLIKNLSGISHSYKDFYEGLTRHQSNKAIRELKKQFESYLVQTDQVTLIPATTKQLDLDPKNMRFISKTSATKILGCRIDTLNKLIASGKLKSREIQGRILIEKQDAIKLKSLRKNNWSMNQAVEKLGLSAYQIRQLIRQGHVIAIEQPSKQNRDWLIDKKSTKVLFEKLKQGTCKTSCQEGRSLKSMMTSGYNITRLIEDMKEGRIHYKLNPNKQKELCFLKDCNFHINNCSSLYLS